MLINHLEKKGGGFFWESGESLMGKVTYDEDKKPLLVLHSLTTRTEGYKNKLIKS